jgi:hypothetical protein
VLIFAVVGWLIAHAASAEQVVPNQTTTVGQETERQDNASPLSLPVRIIKNPEQSETDKRSEKEAQQRDIEDLAAQQLMAKATDEIVWLSKLQLFLTLCGTLALLYTIRLNRHATNAAVEANKNTAKSIDQERENAQRELRAYIRVLPAGINKTEIRDRVIAHVVIENVGRMIAKEVTAAVRMEIRRGKIQSVFKYGANLTRTIGSIIPGVEVPMGSYETIHLKELPKVGANSALESSLREYLYVWGEIKYKDGFDESRWTTFCFRYDPDNMKANCIDKAKARFHTSGNDAV